jgi:predicted O-methyltransferase YrrM
MSMQIPLLDRLRSALADVRATRAERGAVERLRGTLARLPVSMDADSVVEFLFGESAAPIQPWQFEDEFRALAKLVEARRPRCVLEIGTADGGTLFAHSRLAADDALVISLDLPRGPFGGGYPAWRIPLYRSFARPGQRLELVRADSHAPSTADQIERLLGDRRLDYAFIDGDHTYAGVRQDFELCRRFIADDAMIAFHDIAEHRPETNCEVRKLWLELRDRHDHDELVHEPPQDHYGIGVLHFRGSTDRGTRAG